jgi:hypothetical protein
MSSDYLFVICWPLYRLSYFDLCLLITSLVSFGHCIVCPTSIYAFWLPLWYLLAIVLSILLWFMPSDYPFGIFWPLYRLSYFELRLLITHLVSFGHCIVFLTSIDGFWLTFGIFRLFYLCDQCKSPPRFLNLIPVHARCTRYNLEWCSLSMSWFKA